MSRRELREQEMTLAMLLQPTWASITIMCPSKGHVVIMNAKQLLIVIAYPFSNILKKTWEIDFCKNTLLWGIRYGF